VDYAGQELREHAITRGHEAAPLIVNNTMYIVTPWPNLLYALDLTKPGAPMKWVYEPTLDMHTVAVDAATGKDLEDEAGRHQHGRVDDDGSGRDQGQGDRRQ
jgi:glucose dehydrogenase